ncbi:hypothetical protein B0H13DRAFT_1959578 [Mycena leptocephala]|nr:hypothetical protein B0H13DRAFT_2043881 [Mycena leptocephala]KAJ7931243.1 hypothetical protein B0H13DRAFT_1959578 [Mycena leptocephala]
MNRIACSVFLLFYPKGVMCSTQDTATSQAILLNISSSVLSTTLSDGCNIVGRLFQDGHKRKFFPEVSPFKVLTILALFRVSFTSSSHFLHLRDAFPCLRAPA